MLFHVFSFFFFTKPHTINDEGIVSNKIKVNIERAFKEHFFYVEFEWIALEKEPFSIQHIIEDWFYGRVYLVMDFFHCNQKKNEG